MLKIALPRTQSYVLGALITAFSVYSLIRMEYAIGISALLLALGIATTYQYIAFDFAAGSKGGFICLLGLIPLGRWKRLPVINHVFIKRFSELVREEIGDSGAYQTVQNQRYNIMLSVTDPNAAIIVLKTLDLKKARKIAQDISSTGNLELKDYTISRR